MHSPWEHSTGESYLLYSPGGYTACTKADTTGYKAVAQSILGKLSKIFRLDSSLSGETSGVFQKPSVLADNVM